MEEKNYEILNHKVQGLQNDISIIKLKMNDIFKILKELKEKWPTQH